MATQTLTWLDEIERSSVRIVAGTSAAEVVASSAGVGAAFAGLIGASPLAAGATAVIAIGLALILEGGAIGARFAATLRRHEGDALTSGDLVGAVTAGLLAGLAGLGLGVLALADVAPVALLPTAGLLFGVGSMFGSAALPHATFTDRAGFSLPPPPRDLLMSAAAAQALVGLAATVFCVIGLLGTAPVTLALASLFLVGASELVTGVALGVRFMDRALRER